MTSERPDEQTSTEESNRRSSIAARVLQIELPCDSKLIRQTRSLLVNPDVRVNELVQLISDEPVVTLEVLRAANAMVFAAARPPVVNVQGAVVRLGSGNVLELLEKLERRPQLTHIRAQQHLEHLRRNSVQIGFVSLTIAAVAARSLARVAQIAGLFSNTSLMVACAHLGPEYAVLAAGKRRASIAYKLKRDMDFDPARVQINYLRTRGIPDQIILAFDRQSQKGAQLRFVVDAAIEIVEAFAKGKGNTYRPNKLLPANSSLRLLKLSERQRETIYELVDAYLNPQSPAHREEATSFVSREAVRAEAIADEATEATASTEAVLTEVEAPVSEEPRYLTGSDEQLGEADVALSADGKQLIGSIYALANETLNVQDLLTQTLELLVGSGPYSRAALLIVGESREDAFIHTAVGGDLPSGKARTVNVDDPLSALALCLTRISSFNNSGTVDLLAPFGVSAYAISPIRMQASGPVLLYADCGQDRSLGFESRKIFRLVVGLLNRFLPTLPGGLRAPASTVVQTRPRI